jgi:iron only hydrogenase large subunit-like protein
MPCFDKKLEASREELTDRWWSSTPNETTTPAVRDVDCVITSRELVSLADARGIQLASLPLKPLTTSERPPFPDSSIERFLFPKPRRRGEQQSDAGTSGGYLYHILKTYQARNPGSSISIQRGRNADVDEYILSTATGKPIFKCARYYGFRNIQNLVRKLKPPKPSKLPGAVARRAAARASEGSDYAYVEVMACPGGCTNGGGQMRIEDVQAVLPQTRGEAVEKLEGQGQKEWLRRVDEAYFSAESDEEVGDGEGDVEMTDGVNGQHDDDDDEGEMVNGISTKGVHEFLEYWVRLVDVPLDQLVYTSFRKVESDVGKGKNLDDSQRIAQIAGMSGGGW